MFGFQLLKPGVDKRVEFRSIAYGEHELVDAKVVVAEADVLVRGPFKESVRVECLLVCDVDGIAIVNAAQRSKMRERRQCRASMKICKGRLDRVDIHRRHLTANISEVNSAVSIYKKDHAGIDRTQLSTDGLVDFVLAVDICRVIEIEEDQKHLVKRVLIYSQTVEGGIDLLAILITPKQKIMDDVVVLEEDFLLNRVLLKDFHLQQADDILDRHGVEGCQVLSVVMDNQVVVDCIRAWYAYSQGLFSRTALVLCLGSISEEQLHGEIRMRLVLAGVASAKGKRRK